MTDSPPPKDADVEPGPSSSDGQGKSPMEHESENQGQGGAYEFDVKEQDRWLPIANGLSPFLANTPLVASRVVDLLPDLHINCAPYWSFDHAATTDADIRNFAPVARIMKTALPDNAKIAKEAKECMQECVSEFISFITSEASEKCHQEKRKTVNGEDILFAMTSLGFENYAEALKIYLTKFRETQSARGDAQAQSGPNSGYGGPLGGPGAPSDVPSSANFQAPPGATNNILSPQGLANHDPNSYTANYPQVMTSTHNGTGPDTY
ncbi:MAG: hypothetical protein M1814_003375 [Vezdaea aestivalis]|nr:MAG: hypothetical protein M1814_003375 [Vezdaea aestivalis]